jgi:hypothetical protein
MCREVVLVFFLALCNFSIAFGAAKDEWSFNPIEKNVEVSSEYVLSNGKVKTILSDFFIPPSVKGVKKIGGLDLVIYLQSVDGTFAMQNTYYAAVFNLKTNEFFGTYPYRYELIAGKGSSKDLEQPVWKVGEKEIHITEKELLLDVKIPLPK